MSTVAQEKTRARLLDSAVQLFAEHGVENVSIVGVAKGAEITSQAVYRYFKNKEELYRTAIATDLEALTNETLGALASVPMPALSGAIWHIYSAVLPAHPLARKVLSQRSSEHFEIFDGLDSTKALIEMMITDFEIAQQVGAIRQDIEIRPTVDSLKDILIYVMFPLIAEDKYGSPEWLRATNIILATLFHPIPDTSNPEVLKAFGDSFQKLAQMAPQSKTN